MTFGRVSLIRWKSVCVYFFLIHFECLSDCLLSNRIEEPKGETGQRCQIAVPKVRLVESHHYWGILVGLTLLMTIYYVNLV